MESNEIEITESHKTSYYIIFGCLTTIFIILPIGFSTFGIELLSFFLIFEGILLAIVVPLGIYSYSRNKWVKYAISKQKFMIVKPKKVRFEISWSEFDVMKFKLLGREFSTLKPSEYERETNVFKIKFLRANKQIKSIKFRIPFTKKARQLAEAIINYAKRMGKDVILRQRAIELRNLDL